VDVSGSDPAPRRRCATLPASGDNRGHRPLARRGAAALRQPSPPRPAGLLAPVLNEGAESRLNQPAPPCNLSGVTRRDCVRLVRGQDAPMKAVCSVRSGVSVMPRAWHSGSTSNSALGLRRRHSVARAGPPACRVRNSRANRRRSSAWPSGARTHTLRNRALFGSRRGWLLTHLTSQGLCP
jgi:hypothetical protein